MVGKHQAVQRQQKLNAALLALCLQLGLIQANKIRALIESPSLMTFEMYLTNLDLLVCNDADEISLHPFP